MFCFLLFGLLVAFALLFGWLLCLGSRFGWLIYFGYCCLLAFVGVFWFDVDWLPG